MKDTVRHIGSFMEQQTLWIISAIGAGTLIGVFYKMKGGFGPVNLRAVGIVLIALLASIISLAKANDLNAALGILGTIAGYLFGANSVTEKNANGAGSSFDAGGSEFGDNAKLAGRDINETVNNIQSKIDDISKILGDENSKINRLLESQSSSPAHYEYLLNTVFERNANEVYDAIFEVLKQWSTNGWALVGMTNLYDQSDALVLVFRRETDIQNAGAMQRYRGSRMEPE